MRQPDPITDALQMAVQAGTFPGAVLLVRHRGRLVYQHACGAAALIPEREPVSVETIYDLASLTKPLATTTAILCLVQDGQLDLQGTVGNFFPDRQDSALREATVFQLLNHCSGLPGWRPFYERIAEQDRDQPGFLGSEAARRAMLEMICREPLEYAPGSRSVYSDLGFILLGMIVERVTQSSLDTFCNARVYARIGAAPLWFMRTGTKGDRLATRVASGQRVAPTEDIPWRRRVLRGEVHDDNAYALGGVAGHAGLFGTAQAVLAISGLWLDSYVKRNPFLSPDLVSRFASRATTPGSSWGLGWDTPSAPSSSGTRFSSRSFGHLGFTGTSLWIDPLCELEVVLLSNRVHPTRQNVGIQTFRPRIHDIVYEEIAGGKSTADS